MSNIINGTYGVADGTGYVNSTSGFYQKNHVINGNFDIWQRGTSHSTAGYGSADRWWNAIVGSANTVSQQVFTVGQSNVPNNPTYFCRNIVTSVAGAGNYAALAHRIEDVNSFSGKTVTLSFWAKSDASRNIATEYSQLFGTGGSPSALVTTIGVNTHALTTSWQKFTTTVSIPSITGKTLGTGDNDYLQITFWLDAGSNFSSRTNNLGQQSGTFDIAQVQIEDGSAATPFEYRPIGIELEMCKRYYQVTSWRFSQYMASGITAVCVVHRSVEMRAAPTAADTSLSNTTFTNCSGAVGSSTTTNAITIPTSSAAIVTLTASTTGMVEGAFTIASSAEL